MAHWTVSWREVRPSLSPSVCVCVRVSVCVCECPGEPRRCIPSCRNLIWLEAQCRQSLFDHPRYSSWTTHRSAGGIPLAIPSCALVRGDDDEEKTGAWLGQQSPPIVGSHPLSNPPCKFRSHREALGPGRARPLGRLCLTQERLQSACGSLKRGLAWCKGRAWRTGSVRAYEGVPAKRHPL